ncbi:methyltransferase domain protein [Mycobacterium xenopi 3993]|nr:methyltransferase domain protein [Mycobacterium xenopi 3993]
MLDLGAGTGKLTTRLVERGLDVVAVDPIPEMLDVLRKSLPDTPRCWAPQKKYRCRTTALMPF